MDNNISLASQSTLSANEKPSLIDHWLKHIKSRNKSGLSKAAYCREHNLVAHQYHYWEQKLRVKPVKLIPVKLEHPIIREQMLCSMGFKNGIQLKIYDSSVLPILVSILGYDLVI